jgi:hypothetical protein
MKTLILNLPNRKTGLGSLTRKSDFTEPNSFFQKIIQVLNETVKLYVNSKDKPYVEIKDLDNFDDNQFKVELTSFLGIVIYYPDTKNDYIKLIHVKYQSATDSFYTKTNIKYNKMLSNLKFKDKDNYIAILSGNDIVGILYDLTNKKYIEENFIDEMKPLIMLKFVNWDEIENFEIKTS